MNNAQIDLDKRDIKEAINEWLKKKYPNFEPERMFIEYSIDKCQGQVNGKLKDTEGK